MMVDTLLITMKEFMYGLFVDRNSEHIASNKRLVHIQITMSFVMTDLLADIDLRCESTVLPTFTTLFSHDHSDSMSGFLSKYMYQ